MQGLVRFTGKGYEDIRQDLTRDLYLTSVEAVDYGLIDKVIEIPVPDLLSLPLLDFARTLRVISHISRTV